MIISSQHMTQEEIVNSYIARIQNGETFTAVIATLENNDMAEWDITGILVDGHHRLEAYRRLDMQIEFVEADYNYQVELDNLGMEAFLETHYNDGDWTNIEDGMPVF